jgi:hypothetical protein
MKSLLPRDNMRVHFYIIQSDIYGLNKLLQKEQIEPGSEPIKIAANYFEGSYMVDISHDEYVRLNDNELLISLLLL